MTTSSLVMAYVIGTATYPRMWSLHPSLNDDCSVLSFQGHDILRITLHTTLHYIARTIREKERELTDGL